MSPFSYKIVVAFLQKSKLIETTWWIIAVIVAFALAVCWQNRSWLVQFLYFIMLACLSWNVSINKKCTVPQFSLIKEDTSEKVFQSTDVKSLQWLLFWSIKFHIKFQMTWMGHSSIALFASNILLLLTFSVLPFIG